MRKIALIKIDIHDDYIQYVNFLSEWIEVSEEDYTLLCQYITLIDPDLRVVVNYNSHIPNTLSEIKNLIQEKIEEDKKKIEVQKQKEEKRRLKKLEKAKALEQNKIEEAKNLLKSHNLI